jgi:hypothetical protein
MGAAVLALLGLAAAGDALAISGESEEQTIGTHRARNACSALRGDPEGDLYVDGDLYLVCNAERGGPGGRKPCDVTSIGQDADGVVVRGSAFGFCADSFGSGDVRALPTDAPLLEEGVELAATLFGTNTGIVKPAEPVEVESEPVEVESDVICTTFADTESRVCVEVAKTLPSPESFPFSCGPSDELIVRGGREDPGCQALEQELRDTITGRNEAQFSHALFWQAKGAGVGDAGSQALFVCGDYVAQCATATGATEVQYIDDFGIQSTPGCGWTRYGYKCW